MDSHDWKKDSKRIKKIQTRAFRLEGFLVLFIILQYTSEFFWAAFLFQSQDQEGCLDRFGLECHSNTFPRHENSFQSVRKLYLGFFVPSKILEVYPRVVFTPLASRSGCLGWPLGFFLKPERPSLSTYTSPWTDQLRNLRWLQFLTYLRRKVNFHY